MDTLTTNWGLYYPSDLNVLRPIFTGLKGSLLDLGAGLGDVVQAAYLCGLDSSGIEASESLWRNAKCRDRIELANFLHSRISGYNYLYYFLTGCKEEAELFQKIKKEATGSVIISNFSLPPSTLDSAIEKLGLKVEKKFSNVAIGRCACTA